MKVHNTEAPAVTSTPVTSLHNGVVEQKSPFPQRGPDSSSQALYTEDVQPFGAELVVAMLFGVAITFGITVGFGAVVNLIFRGLTPISQICECPANAASFSAEVEAEFYDGCVDTESTWYKTHNAVPSNQTFQADGWFGSAEWSRETLRDHDLKVGATSRGQPPDVYPCPVYRPFWSPPVDIVGVLTLVVTNVLVAMSIATAAIRKTEVFADRVKVTYLGGRRTVAPLCALEGEPAKHELAGLPPLREVRAAVPWSPAVAAATAAAAAATAAAAAAAATAAAAADAAAAAAAAASIDGLPWPPHCARTLRLLRCNRNAGCRPRRVYWWSARPHRCRRSLLRARALGFPSRSSSPAVLSVPPRPARHRSPMPPALQP